MPRRKARTAFYARNRVDDEHEIIPGQVLNAQVSHDLREFRGVMLEEKKYRRYYMHYKVFIYYRDFEQLILLLAVQYVGTK